MQCTDRAMERGGREGYPSAGPLRKLSGYPPDAQAPDDTSPAASPPGGEQGRRSLPGARWRQSFPHRCQGTAIGSHSLPGAPQDVRIEHLVIERVESSRRARLGGPVQRPLELSSASPCISTGGVVSLSGISPALTSTGHKDKAGSLPSGALCCRRRHQYRMPLRLPLRRSPLRLAT